MQHIFKNYHQIIQINIKENIIQYQGNNNSWLQKEWKENQTKKNEW